MRFLHTADWHLGVEMDNRERVGESRALLKRILAIAQEKKVDTLLVAGDVFNTHSPSNEATRLYYDFLKDIHDIHAIKNVVIIAGNHDSPSYLEAPAGVLELLNVHVIGSVQENNFEREIIPLKNEAGEVEAVACAVPYMFSPGLAAKSHSEQDAAYEEFVAAHYKAVVELAKSQYPQVPIVALGHFFATGGKVSEDNAVRGNLHCVRVDRLPMDDIAYLALGHLHSAQLVNKQAKARYSGSLMKMNFDEWDKDKHVVYWDSSAPDAPEEIPLLRSNVPEVCRMAYLKGTYDELSQQLKELSVQKLDGILWVAALNTGAPVVELMTHLKRAVENDKTIDIVFARNQNSIIYFKGRTRPALTDLKEKKPEELFDDILKEEASPLNEGGEPRISQEEQDWYKAQIARIIEECRVGLKSLKKEAENGNDAATEELATIEEEQ